MLADGRLHLSGIELLAPHLTPANTQALLQRAVHKSKEAIKELVAELKPKPDVPDSIRKLPERRGVGAPDQPAHGTPLQRPEPGLVQRPEPGAEMPSDALAPAALQLGPDPVPPPMSAGAPLRERAQKTGLVEPLGQGRYKVQFTASAAFRDKLERLRALMRPSVPDGDLGRHPRSRGHREA